MDWNQDVARKEAAAQGKIVGPPTTNSLVAQLERLRQLCGNAQDVADKAHKISDLIVGSVPQSSQERGPDKIASQTIVGEMRDVIERLSAELYRAREGLGRISAAVGE